MNFETTCALYQAEQVFARYKDPYELSRSSGVSHALGSLTREDWDKMKAKFDMGVLLYSDEAILLRHYLPRFLEWIIEDDADVVDLSIRLHQLNWLHWPTEEVEALRAVFEAWASQSLTNSTTQFPIAFLIEIEVDLRFYLDMWLQARPHELSQWLWKLDWKSNQKVWRWAISPHVEAALEAEFFRQPEGERAQFLSRTIELIRSVRG